MWKKFLGIICLSIQIILFANCSGDNGLLPDMPSAVETQNQYSIPVSEALNIADAFMSNIEGETRAIRMVSKIEVKTSSKTRSLSNGADTLLYLINYSDNAGFALVSADRRLPAIYAISDEGHFEFADTLQNPGLNIFMQSVDERIERTISQQSNAPIVVIPPTKDYYDQFRGVYDVIKPQLTQEMSILNQYSPFNKYCFYKGVQKETGCVPVAFAALMSFYKWPQQCEGYNLPWNDMCEDSSHDAIARLISLLWGYDYLRIGFDNVPVSEFEAGTTPDRYIPTLTKLGFNVRDGFLPFDAEEIYQFMMRGGERYGTPVLARGNTKVGNSYPGHAWVIDGAMKQHGIEILGPGMDGKPQYYPNYPMYLLHCVWGWGGINNGFFNFDDGSIGGNPDEYGEFDSHTPANHPYNFTKNLQYIGKLIKVQ